MNTLDSRSLQIGDCFAVTFESEGELRYSLSPGSPPLPLRVEGGKPEGYLIKVNKRSKAGESNQHTVHVERRDGDIVPDVDSLTIEAGDIVLWYTTDPKVLSFAIAGTGGGGEFGCHALKAGAVYTHAFGAPGTYEWHDPDEKGVEGRIEVSAPDVTTPEKLKAWYSSLEKPATIEIRRGKVSAERLQITVGQTVFWKVWDGSGITIRDKRLTRGT